MPYRTIIDLRAEVGTKFPDNTTGLITPVEVRDMFKDVIDTFAPGYGIMSVDSLTLVALGITPQVVTYDTLLAETDTYTCVPASGTVTRLARGLPSTVNRVSFYADVSAPTGDEVVFSLFRDGVDIPGGGTVSGQGLGNVVQVAFSISSSAEDALDHVYDIRAIKVTGGADNVELANVRFIFEYVPTIGI
jgi:hypothetical protein